MEFFWTNGKYPELKYVELAWKYKSRSGEYKFTRNHVMEVKEAHFKLGEVRKHQDHHEIYATYFLYSSPDQSNALKYGPLVFDIDGDITEWPVVRGETIKIVSYLNTYFNIPYDKLMLFFSGSKGVHIIVPPEVFGVEPTKDLPRDYRKVAQAIKDTLKLSKIDMKIYEGKRVFRLPNTVNCKSALFKVQATLDELLGSVAWEDMGKMAIEPRGLLWPHELGLISQARTKYREILESEIPRRSVGSGRVTWTKNDLPCVVTLLNETTYSGHRNQNYATLISYYKHKGLELEEIYELLSNWRHTKCEPPYAPPLDNGQEIWQTTVSVFKGYPWGCGKMKSEGYCEEDKCPIAAKEGLKECS